MGKVDAFIARLCRCGFSADRAYVTVWDFVKCYGVSALEKYVSDIERSAFRVG